MGTRPAFTLDVGQNKYLQAAVDEMHAILTVNAQHLDGFEPTVAEVILVDSSGSMGMPSTKIAAARRASIAAIDTLRDGALFAIVAGTHEARMVYPARPRLAVATREGRAAAKTAVRQLTDHGGTAMSTWLSLAREIFTTQPAAIRHVILLTDGQNQSESRAQLDAELDACEGLFYCDARGIGDGWASNELLRIVAKLRGTADAAREDSDLVADFQEMTRAAMRKVVPDLRVRFQLLPGADIRFVKQVFPVEADLTEYLERTGDRTAEFVTGPWGEESREYHVCFTIDPTGRESGRDLRLARVDLEVDGDGAGAPEVEVPGRGTPILIHWTDDPVRSSRIHPKVGHYTEHVELREAVNAGCQAYESGDLNEAEQAWGRAVRLATELNNTKNLERLSHLVHIVDAVRGEVRLKEVIERRDLMGVALSSRFSTLSHDPHTPRPHPKPDERPVAKGRRCPNPDCGRVALAGDRRCEACGSELEDQ
ncbi:vWA domain-containing protein [Streptosporangium sp. 'caverna']|uniref:VWA domain-containing protein n=1 Tax=Streptosporangium sp. 'caverna' TaxID=2202249 RepID=UPI000D7D7BB4|nr:vWA domain-containing protein [Streptosporangium sp. 'caverna']AWS41661.1 VWA domain-containing protein [Streptosporangium sp. 'caverna']